MTKGRAEDSFKRALKPITQQCPSIFLRNLLDLTHFGVAEPGCDFQLSLGTLLIECKNTDRDGALIDRPSDRQKNQLDKYGGYIFLGMWDKGYPRLPKGADFYLLPWQRYQEFVLDYQIAIGKSYRRHPAVRAHGASEIIPVEYKCEYDNGVVIPAQHVFWKDCAKILKEVSQIIEGVIASGETREA